MTWSMFNKHHKICENIFTFAWALAENVIKVIRGCTQQARLFLILGQAASPCKLTMTPVGYHSGSEQASISWEHLPHYTLLYHIDYSASCQGWRFESRRNQGTSYTCNGKFAIAQTYILPFTESMCVCWNEQKKCNSILDQEKWAVQKLLKH